MIRVLRIDPVREPATAALSGVFADRVRTFTSEHSPYQDAADNAKSTMARLWAGDPGIMALLMVDEADGRVVGHMLAHETSSEWVFIMQTKADGNVGDAVKQAEADVVEWAKSRGRKGVWMATHRNPEGWAKKYGYKVTHTIMSKKFEEADV